MISKELRKEIDETIRRDKLYALRENISFSERFKTECIIIDFEEHYGSELYGTSKLYGCKFGIGTIMDSIDEMFDKYEVQLAAYVPFVILDQDKAVVMRIFERNERKHEKRNEEIVYNYKSKSKGSKKLMLEAEYNIELDFTAEEALKNVTSHELRQALGELTEKQQRRVIKHELLGYSLTAIAEDEGCSVKAVSDSVSQGMDKLRKLMQENQE